MLEEVDLRWTMEKLEIRSQKLEWIYDGLTGFSTLFPKKLFANC
jgi:hypothetical protein